MPSATDCARLSTALSDYVDDALSPSKRQSLEDHLAGCRACQTALEQLRQTVALVGRLREVELPDAITGAPRLATRRRRP
jgi:anti-sigma factor RsiW